MSTPTPAGPVAPGTPVTLTQEEIDLKGIIEDSEVLTNRLCGPKPPERTPTPFWK
ncbi:hypothetical protein GCM10023086_52750 [Streptomyces venetus]|uniref:Uncharacterized protein n=1 Tax=Streptomyces venetus TaxID=1701086 RepID=A0ABP8GJL7_9ACTN